MYSFLLSGYSVADAPSLQIFSFAHNTLMPISELHTVNPSFACYSAPFIFTLSEQDHQAQIQMYKWHHNKLSFLDEVHFNGGGLCHLSYSPKHHTLFGACYQTGHIFSIGVLNEKFAPPKNLIALPALLQDGLSRAHCAQMDAHETFLYATNIHTDTIYCYQVQNDMLIPNVDFPSLQLPSGNGPRHILFHPILPIGYVITEYSNKIFVLQQNFSTGTLQIIQEISTLPTNYYDKSYCSNFIITPNHKYLLAANRGHNSLTHFEIQPDGSLKYLDRYTCGGIWPRHISCTHDGAFLMVCNQYSNDLCIFKMDATTGVVGEQVTQISFPNPSFILEI